MFLDLLILSSRSIPQEVQEELLSETYPWFLECGRQISPQFQTLAQFRSPDNERTREFVARVCEEEYVIHGNDGAQTA